MGRDGFSVVVPATTANLGPGFDSIGLALSLYMTVNVLPAEKWNVIYESDDYSGLPDGEENLIVKTILDVVARYNQTLSPLQLNVKTDIPLGKGLGSSATAIAAGIVIVDHLLELKLSLKEKVKIGSELEGHADNVSAALLGGVTISYFDGEDIDVIHIREPNVGAVILVPPNALRTEESRGLLPAKLDHGEGILGSAASSVMTAAIAQDDWKTAGRMMEKDIFHEVYRKRLLQEFDAIREKSKELGAYGMTISGAGPSLFIAVKPGEQANLAKSLAVAFPYYTAIAVGPSVLGAKVN